MEYIPAPWRAKYVKDAAKTEGCFLCATCSRDNDTESMILYRGRNNFVILNRYPYTPGHLLISPYRHESDFYLAPKESTDEMTDLLKMSIKILKHHYRPHGFNTGMNLGKSSGAGVADHFHCHVIPRWTGDSNFMPIIGKTKVVIETLEQTFQGLAPLFHAERENQNRHQVPEE